MQTVYMKLLQKGLETCLDKSVLLASDGAAVNTRLKNGLIKLIWDDRPWVGFVWCLAHRLELGIKDALSDWIKPVEGNLQYLYYMYEKFSKKPVELKELFSILNEAYVFQNQEVKPHRATGKYRILVNTKTFLLSCLFIDLPSWAST